jgi:hypothetical protein
MARGRRKRHLPGDGDQYSVDLQVNALHRADFDVALDVGQVQKDSRDAGRDQQITKDFPVHPAPPVQSLGV